MKNLLIILILIAISYSCQEKAKNNTTEETLEKEIITDENAEIKIGGTYEFGDFINKKDVYGQLLVFPDSDTSIVFYLSKSHDALDYFYIDIDEVMGRTFITDNKARFQAKSNCSGEDYSLYLEFKPNSVEIIQDDEGGGDCSFSYNFRADGIFEKTNSEIPKSYTNSFGDQEDFENWIGLNVGIDFELLEKRNDIFYFNNQAYTGTAIREPKVKEYWQTEKEVFQMQNGKLHGQYVLNAWENGVCGNYKNGLKDGKWVVYESYLYEVQHYKDGLKHGEWKYYDEMESDEPYKVEVYENGKKIK
ncbi:MAG: hypothetical protein GX793_10150 [Bacteroidales bacterium]|jgi:hypothetical protein|nr:hypothetical protein [Bacteroidales bacterium]MCK9500193.1 hypothetical protein [Bacteroidales bacterium]MDY0315196.1 hypothetical protein [Bacteroidales bacterium]NLB87408.1 hypothetical protein [Bacteroidales bacterium]